MDGAPSTSSSAAGARSARGSSSPLATSCSPQRVHKPKPTNVSTRCSPGLPPAEAGSQVLLHVFARDPLGRAREPGLDDRFLQVVEADRIQADEDGRVAIEVGRGEEDTGVVGEQCFLGAQMLDPRAENRSARRVLAESEEVFLAERTLPDEQLVPNAPGEPAPARRVLGGLRQR